MSYLSLLFTSVTQGMSNTYGASREIELQAFAASNAAERAGDHAGSRADEYLLPSGIASLEHWLDLNA